jgi:hypothetical protein
MINEDNNPKPLDITDKKQEKKIVKKYRKPSLLAIIYRELWPFIAFFGFMIVGGASYFAPEPVSAFVIGLGVLNAALILPPLAIVASGYIRDSLDAKKSSNQNQQVKEQQPENKFEKSDELRNPDTESPSSSKQMPETSQQKEDLKQGVDSKRDGIVEKPVSIRLEGENNKSSSSLKL